MESRTATHDDTAAGDPYTVAGISGEVTDRLAVSNRGAAAWAVLFWLNTPLCFLLSWDDAADTARFGILAGCGVLFFPGVLLVRSIPRVRKPLIPGAIVVGLSQFLAFPQLYAGMLALAVCERVGLVRGIRFGDDTYSSFAAGFVMTVITGGTLIVASLLVALLLRPPVRFLTDTMNLRRSDRTRPGSY